MIYGITHDKDGQTLIRRSVTKKLAIGRGPNPKAGKNYPEKLNHFIFLTKSEDGNQWVDDPELTRHYGIDPTEVVIILMDDEIERIFRTETAWWITSGKKCWGDGEQATRRTEKNPDGEPWQPCANHGCPEFENGDCKPSADLYFIFADFPTLGSTVRLHTSSYQSIREIHTALTELKSMFGGRLTGLPVKLSVRPEKNVYEQGGKRHTGTKYVLALELQAASLPEMLKSVTESAKVFADLKRVMGASRLELIEDDDARAPEIAGEFVNVVPKAQLMAPPDPEQEKRILAFHAAGEKAGLNAANRHMLLGKHNGDLEAAMKELQSKSLAVQPAQPAGEPGHATTKRGKKGAAARPSEQPQAAPAAAKTDTQDVRTAQQINGTSDQVKFGF